MQLRSFWWYLVLSFRCDFYYKTWWKRFCDSHSWDEMGRQHASEIQLFQNLKRLYKLQIKSIEFTLGLEMKFLRIPATFLQDEVSSTIMSSSQTCILLQYSWNWTTIIRNLYRRTILKSHVIVCNRCFYFWNVLCN